MTQRDIYQQDALEWLSTTTVPQESSIVASLPDLSEFPQLSLEEWKHWFVSTAKKILSKTPENGVTIFYQSDIKHEGQWVDKGYLCLKAGEELKCPLLWHKIVCRVPPGATTYGRASYTHILCFSKKFRPDLARSTPDILPVMGEKTWERGMGLEACIMIATFIAEEVKSRALVHPFCGQGGLLAVAEALGLAAIGIDKGRKCAQIARTLMVDLKNKRWIFDRSHDAKLLS